MRLLFRNILSFFSENLKYTVIKNFKILDCWVSIILIVVFVAYGFIEMSGKSLIGYFIVGGWQIVSMIIHQVNHLFTQKGEQRIFYHKMILTLVIALVVIIGLAQLVELFFIPILVILFLLLVLSPIMAIYYTYLCYEETYIKMKRPMELLK